MEHPDLASLSANNGPSPKQPRSDPYDYPAIDRYAHHHLNARLPALNATLARASRNCRSHGFPDWGAIPSQGKFFMVQCQLLGVRRVLEVGTFGGHGAIWCAAAHPELRVTTIEASEEHAAVARENLDAAGVSERVELVRGNARDVLPRLLSEVGSGQRERYGMVIVDVEDRADAWAYLDQSVGLCAGRACVIAHLQVRKSNLSVETEDEKGANAKGSRELVENMAKDPRMTGVLLMTMGEQNYDLIMAVVQDDAIGGSSLSVS